MWYAVGKCRNGTRCRFAHGEADRNPNLIALTDRAAKKEKDKRSTSKMPEPMFIQAETMPSMLDKVPDWMGHAPSYLPPPGVLAMQHMGYPMSDTTGLLTGGWNMDPMMQGAGYGIYNVPNVAPVPAHVAPEPAAPPSELNKVKTLSKHIKSLTKQVKMLQNTVNQTMRSDSELSTFSGNTRTVSGSSSNDDQVPESETSETGPNDLDNGWGNRATRTNLVDHKLA
jgi:hypothetical protein